MKQMSSNSFKDNLKYKLTLTNIYIYIYIYIYYIYIYILFGPVKLFKREHLNFPGKGLNVTDITEQYFIKKKTQTSHIRIINFIFHPVMFFGKNQKHEKKVLTGLLQVYSIHKFLCSSYWKGASGHPRLRSPTLLI